MQTVEREINLIINAEHSTSLSDEIRAFVENSHIEQKSIIKLASKRFVDVIISFFVITLVLSWAIPIIAIIVWLDSKEYPFFSQLRNGLNNKPYVCYKFTTMCKNDHAHVKAAITGDSRITRVGKFLRVSCLDELPQFFNVLIGNMSIVGPRPHMIADNEKFSKLINGYEKRHLVKPGITGLAQVKGYKGPINSDLEIYKRIENDIYYAKNNSIKMDFIIIGKLFHILFKNLENLVRTETKYQLVLQNEILKVLTYFGIFKHPLKANEILSLLLIESTEFDVQEILNLLLIEGKIFSSENYYFLNNDPTCISKRLNGEVKANELLAKAKKVAMIISYFPFVRFVGISGSLSKGYADNKNGF